MKLDGRRRSNNVEDRRSSISAKTGIGGGIVGAVIFAVITFLSGGDMGDVVNQLLTQGNIVSSQSDYVPDAEDERLFDLASKVFAGTEDVWTEEFQRQGWGEYRQPKLVVFHGSVNSACGQASSQVGPFYCSGDETVYIDLEFFKDMKTSIGGGGDFAYAYVIAHEVGHHVQHLLGTLDKTHSLMSRMSEKESNQMSVRLELQADFLAGVWANRDNAMFGSIEPGDVENAIDVASKIGDDYLQRKAYGYEVPDAFNHGRSEQRARWLRLGISCGDPNRGDTFSPRYEAL